MPFDADDLADLLDADMPGYALATIGGVEVAGRFNDGYALAGGVVGTARRSFMAAGADLAAVVSGTTVSIAGTDYEVAGPPQPQRSGLTLLELVEAG